MNTNARDENAVSNVLPFDRSRARRHVGHTSVGSTESRGIVAVVTVTRFINDERVHVQVPVFAREIHSERATRAELRSELPKLSQLLAAGAVEANAHLERIAATRNARPIADFYTPR